MLMQPQFDLPRDGLGSVLRGGADAWDDGAAGALIAVEYFEAPPSAPAQFWIKVSGTWRQAVAWIKASGVWYEATPHVRLGGVWR